MAWWTVVSLCESFMQVIYCGREHWSFASPALNGSDVFADWCLCFLVAVLHTHSFRRCSTIVSCCLLGGAFLNLVLNLLLGCCGRCLCSLASNLDLFRVLCVSMGHELSSL